MNNLTIIGRIGTVGELRSTQKGSSVINISVAVDNGKDDKGEKRPPTWFDVSLWEKQAEALSEYLTVGDRIGIAGQVRLKVYTGQDGKEVHKLAVDFPRVELLGGGSQRTAQQPAGRPAQRPAQRPAARPATRPAPAAAFINDEDISF